MSDTIDYKRQSLEKAAEILSKMEPTTVVQIEGDGTYGFDMNEVLDYGDYSEREFERVCDSVGCIYGLANLLEETAGRDTWSKWSAILAEPENNLFYPDRIDYDKVTPKDAAKATRLFLDGDTDPFAFAREDEPTEDDDEPEGDDD